MCVVATESRYRFRICPQLPFVTADNLPPDQPTTASSQQRHTDAAVFSVRLDDLLPQVRRAIEDAKTPGGWDQTRLQQIIASEFDFLGAFTGVQVTDNPLPGVAELQRSSAGFTSAAGSGSWLVLTFIAPEGRDVGAAERIFQRATRQADRGDLKGAFRDLERISRDFPEVAKYHRVLGQAHLVSGRQEEAEDEFLRALRLDPLDHDALTLLGNLYAARNRPQEAIPLYERSIALSPNVYALNNLGAAVAQTGNKERALEILREAVALDPSYPNAWYGLGLTLSSMVDLSLIPESIHCLDEALRVMGRRASDPAVWDATRGLLDKLVVIQARESVTPAGDAVRRILVEHETRVSASGASLPIRIEQAQIKGALAKIELAWVHDRSYHRLIVNPGTGLEREHFVLHELEHLALAEAARSERTNRWFASSPETRARALRDIRSDVQKLSRKGLSESQANEFTTDAIDGLLGQTFNFPVDLLIETRLLKRYPEARELFYYSIKRQLETAARIAGDASIRGITPSKIFRANTAMNGAMVLWFEEHFPSRTDFVAQFDRMEAWSLSKRLYASWAASAARWAPGEEYQWVDHWAEMLGIRNWYTWQDGNPSADPASGGALDPDSTPKGDPSPTGADASDQESPLSAAESTAAAFYMLGALEWVDQAEGPRVQMMAAHAALRGSEGISYHDRDAKYQLAGYPGEPLSGLHFMSVLYVLIKATAPDLEPGINLQAPYAMARQMFAGKHRKNGRGQDSDNSYSSEE